MKRFLLLGALAGCAPPPSDVPSADIVVRGGIVHTADPSRPRAEAFAVRDGRFVFVGSASEVEALVGENTEVIELEGGDALPGLIDGHTHLRGGISLVRGVDLTGIADRAEWERRIAARARELAPGEWIVGGRWDHLLSGGGLPHRETLDRVAPENPVALADIDGHTTWASSLALEIGGVTRDTPDPPGGRIVRDEEGEPTGILLEAAGGLVRRHIPSLDAESERELVAATLENAARLGLTGAHDMGGLHGVEPYLDMALAGRLPLRIWYGPTGVVGRADEAAALRDRVALELGTIEAERGPTFAVGYLKLVADGVLSSRTAAMIDPYADDPENRGFLITEEPELAAAIADFHAAGFPVAIHAIGDLAVRASLDAFEKFRTPGLLPDRVEHIESLHPDDAPRFRELGVLASFQPHHCITGIDVYNTDRLGPERAAWSFAWGGAQEAGADLVFGSDWPTAPLDPLRQLYAATVREKPTGGPPGGWHPHQKVDWEIALDAFTQAPADAAGWGGEIGSITPGKRADFVILDGPVPDPPDRRLLDLAVRSTFVGGQATFTR